MKKLSILYFGPESGTCLDRANAFRRLGHEITSIDPRKLLPASPWIDRITWRLGGHLLSPLLLRKLAPLLAGKAYDICYVDNGEWISANVVRMLKNFCKKVINYNIDDPTGPRDRMRFAAYRQALPFYDMVAVVREENIPEVTELGAKKAIRVYRSADEIAHAPRQINDADREKWKSEVLFLGTWMPERGPFLARLIENGVPLTIRGGHWQKAPEWPILSPYWKGGPIYGDDYAKAIQCARINIGMLSKGNRDLHTTRSLEIPSLGGLFCAERTTEHISMYADGIEAVFWDDADECARLCNRLLAAEDERGEIAMQGHLRYLSDSNKNEAVLQKILCSC
jgi:spore maturation protein CgeB